MISVIVMFLVALAFGFIASDGEAQARESATSARAERDAATVRYDEERVVSRELSEAIGFYDREAASARADLDAVKAGFDTLKGAFPEIDPSIGNYQEAIPAIVSNYTARGRKIQELEASIADLRSQVGVAQGNLRTLGSEKDGQISDLQRQLRDAEQAARDSQASLERTLSSVRSDLADVEGQRRAGEIQLDNNERQARTSLDSLRTRIKEQSKKLTFMSDSETADGKILAVSDSLSLGWIDLGSKNRLALGTRFHVVGGKPGASSVKAWAEVTRVEDAQAEIMISEVLDPYDPVVAGDVVYNPLYDPVGGRNAVLVGRFSGTYNEKELRGLLDHIGVRVQGDVDETTDFIIVGLELYRDEDGEPLEEPVEPSELPVFKNAVAMGVSVVELTDIRRYFKN
ncbi:MAG: hypothetical protein QF724_00225 [Planctomycetota bacterium]|jgi:predicted  nucleic acid-binding Zn-ribbon protein|nr:hypothetical protein [Planctomycetota bacterium]MDP6837344.1 hypothetical protein [Planctomycetota bacterium]